jgi:hypothetical protein
MSEFSPQPLEELDGLLRRAVEESRQVLVGEAALQGALARLARRGPPPRRPGLLRRVVAACVLVGAGVLLFSQAPAAWAQVAGAAPAAGVRAGAPAGGRPAKKLRTLLFVHVGSLLAGYAAFALAWLLSCAVLLAMLFGDASRLLRFTVRASVVLVGLGGLLWLVGMVLGAVWAKGNLGRFWGWDVPELHGLFTLLVGVAWLLLTVRQARAAVGLAPGATAAGCFWALLAAWWTLACFRNGVFIALAGAWLLMGVLLNGALLAAAWWARRRPVRPGLGG